MSKYLFTEEQIQQLIEKSIDLFLKYQYGWGYEEPMAKSAAVMDVLGALKGGSGERKSGSRKREAGSGKKD
ncbi:MAG: hypothetical protein ACP5SH_00050 [Syntrophobacteraceae bacterium]